MADKSEQWFDRVFKLTGREKRLPRFPECERIILQGLLLTMQQLSRTTLPSSHLTGNPSISSNFFQHPFSVFSPTLKTFPCFPLLKFYPWFSLFIPIPEPLSPPSLPFQSYPSSDVPLSLQALSYPGTVSPSLHASPTLSTSCLFPFKPCPILAPSLRPFRPVLRSQCPLVFIHIFLFKGVKGWKKSQHESAFFPFFLAPAPQNFRKYRA